MFISYSVSSQNRLWERLYDYNNTGVFWEIKKDGNEYYILGGRDPNDITAQIPISAIFYKFNENFDTLWTLKNIDESDMDGDWIKTDSNRMMLGTTRQKSQSNADAYDIILRTLDTSGTILNTVVIGAGANNNQIYKILKCEDKGFLIFGTNGNLIDGPPYWQYGLYKTDSLGNILWAKEYGRSNTDYPIDLIRSKDGSYLIYGNTDLSNYTFHPYLIKIKADGTLIKQDSIIVKKYSLEEYVYYPRTNIIECIDGGYAIIGEYDIDGTGTKSHSFLVKLDTSLNVEWKYIDSTLTSSWLAFKKIVQLQDSSYLVIADKSSSYGLMYRISKDGNLISRKAFPSAICDDINWGNFLDISVQSDSTFIVCGTGNVGGTLKGYLAKFDSLWSVPYDPTIRYCDTPPIADYICEQDTNSLKLRYTNTANPGVPYGIIEVCQWKFEDSTASGQLTPTFTLSSLTSDSVWAKLIVTNNLGCKDTIAKKVKVNFTKFVSAIEPQEKTKFHIYVYPNPANDVINFRIGGESEKYRLVINNFLGEQVGDYDLTSQEFKLTLIDYSTGMYFYKLTDEAGNGEYGKFVKE